MPALNGRVAGVLFAGLMLGVVVAGTVEDVFLAMVSLIAMLLVTGIQWTEFRRGLRPFLFFACLAVLFGGLGPGTPLIDVGPLRWSREEVARASFFGLRLLLFGGVAVWLTVRVGTARMLVALTRVGDRLKPWGIDVSAVLLTIGLATRFLPLLQEEAVRLNIGFRARGARLLGRGPVGAIRFAAGLAIPLLAAAFRRAESLANAVQIRLQGGRPDQELLAILASPGGASVSSVDGRETATRKSTAHRQTMRWGAAVAVVWIPLLVRWWVI